MNRDKNILLVEDEAVIAMLMREQLAEYGFPKPDYAATGEKAILAAEKNRPDIVVMDIGLPGRMNGIDTASQLKEKFHIPVIFITGYDTSDMREQAEKLDPVGFLVKPPEITELIELIDAHFQE